MDNNIEQKHIKNTNNRNIMHIAAIEGLMVQVDEHIDALTTRNADQFPAKVEALQVIESFREQQLYRLREVFE